MRFFAALGSLFFLSVAISVPLVLQYLSHEGPAWIMQEWEDRWSTKTHIALGGGTVFFGILVAVASTVMGIVLAVEASQEKK